MFFTFIILALLWLSFVASLESNYRESKTRDIIDIASYITSGWVEDNFTDEKLDTIAYDNDMCILIHDRYGRIVYSYDMAANNCLVHGLSPMALAPYRRKALESQNGYYYAEIMNARLNANTLLFVMAVGAAENPSGFIYLNTSLEPLESTTDIIKSQIFKITLFLIPIGLIISYFLARLIERPIMRLTKSAGQLGKGDYSVKFDGHGYNETETLADSLNFAADEMSKADSLRRDLIANVSHDLRTPLTMVRAYAEMVRDLSGDNPQKRVEHVSVIIEESDRLTALVNDILDLSKLESGHEAISRDTFDISEKINEITGRYKLFSERMGYNLTIDSDKPFFVSADPIKIEQVIYNLINNAINYAGDEKKICVSQKNAKSKTLIEISDDGEGIDPELLPLIFDRYYRTEKSKREVIGTGLGLSIVKTVLQRHGYRFGARSEPGSGSVFWFEMDGHE